jgi:hypothetical protein
LRHSAVRNVIAAALLALALITALIASTQLGQRWLRSEAEIQLSALLSADAHVQRVTLGLEFGLAVHAFGIRVDQPTTGETFLTADRVTAVLETSSLLSGHLGLSRLDIAGLGLEVRRDSAGQWTPALLQQGSPTTPETGSTSQVGLPQAIEAVHLLLRDQEIADAIHFQNAHLALVDESTGRGQKAPVPFRVDGIDAVLERSWLRGESQLTVKGRAASTSGPPAELEIEGAWRGDDTDLSVALTFTGLDLGLLQPYLEGTDRDGLSGELAGRASGVLSIVTPTPERGRIEFDLNFDDFDGRLSLGETELELANTLKRFEAHLTVEPDRFHLKSLRIQGNVIALDIHGTASRPLEPSAIVALQADLSRTSLDDLRTIANRLPATEAAPVLTVLDRMRSGEIPRVGLRGGARLDQWKELLSGTPSQLPETLRLFADIEDVTFGTSPTDTIRDVSGHLTFNGETFEIHRLRGLYNDDPLPQVDLAIRGISRLLSADLDEQQLTKRYRPLPGVGALWDVVRGDSDPATTTGSTPAPIHVHFKELQHPALRYPLRDADILIDPTQRDLHVAIRRGQWAGKPILGEAVLAREPHELRIELVLDAHPADASSAPTGRNPSADLSPPALAARSGEQPGADLANALPTADAQDDRWASGNITTGAIAAGPLHFIQIGGDFTVRGQTLSVTEIAGDLARQGSLNGAADFGLGTRGAVATRIAFTAKDAESDVIAQLFGLEPGFFTGNAGVGGRLDGTLRPGRGLLDEATGQLTIDAYDGEIQQEVPLLAALAHVAEGWSPSAASRTIQYERIDTSIDFDHGLISTDDFALEGPLRIVASGKINLNQDPASIKATLGLFLLRQANQLFGGIPLVNLLVPGSEHGLIGAYFKVKGPVADPSVRALPVESIAKGMPLPPVLRDPIGRLINLLSGDPVPEGGQDASPQERTP